MYEINKKITKKRWKDIDKAFLIENAGKMADKDLATKLNKTVKAIREMRSRLGLKKKSGRGIVELVDKKKDKGTSQPESIEEPQKKKPYFRTSLPLGGAGITNATG